MRHRLLVPLFAILLAAPLAAQAGAPAAPVARLDSAATLTAGRK